MFKREVNSLNYLKLHTGSKHLLQCCIKRNYSIFIIKNKVAMEYCMLIFLIFSSQ